ncbi:MAG: acyl-CoA desaturase [Acidobacteriota bacterium]
MIRSGVSSLQRAAIALVRWFDSAAGEVPAESEEHRVDWLRVVPLVALHLACVAVVVVGWSPLAVLVAVALYLVRMFAITGFYHRYFSHRTFRTSRFFQFAFALLGASSVQRGPLWWAAHHRLHHARSDQPADVHSPRQHGFAWSHIGWLTSESNFRTRAEMVPDLARYPELRFLDRFDTLVPVALAALLFGLGEHLAVAAPALGTNGPQLLVWGFFISTVVLLHATLTVNSLAHVIGRRRYETRDDSRNSLLIALLTLGEGWHNNHHYYPGSTRQGFRWWEIDATWIALVVLSWFGIVSDLTPVPDHVRLAGAT